MHRTDFTRDLESQLRFPNEKQDKSQLKLHDDSYKKPPQSRKPYIVIAKPTDEEKQYMMSIKPSSDLADKLDEVLGEIKKQQSDKWNEIKDVVNTQGTDPGVAIKDAIIHDRVVLIGEQHTLLGSNPARLDLAGMITELRGSGLTHLAVELPQSMQNVFDEFHRRPGEPMSKVLEELKGSKKISSDDYEMLKKMVTLCPDLAYLWAKSRDWGVKIVCVDSPSQSTTGLAREQFMTNAVMDIVNQSPANKVLFCAGNLHAIDTRGAAPLQERRAAELIRGQLALKGETMSTFISILGGQEGDMLSLHPLAKSLARPVSVPTHDESGKGNVLAELNMLKIGLPGMHTELRNFDNILLYPPSRGPLTSTTTRFADVPEGLPMTPRPSIIEPVAKEDIRAAAKNPVGFELPSVELVG